MKVKIIALATNENVDALIKEGKMAEMPSIHDGWNFDFKKQLKNLQGAKGYILVREDTPLIVEGCMIFQLIDNEMPYMAYLEIAPHNKGNKRHDFVAGCLIAYAFKLSLMRGVGDYAGLLNFRVGEQKEEDKLKVMSIYSNKYNAVRIGDSDLMLIADQGGLDLIDKYLS